MAGDTLKTLSVFCFLVVVMGVANGQETMCPGGSSPDSNVIFCDSFEVPGVNENEPAKGNYWSFSDNIGDYNRVTTEFVEGGHSLQYIWKNAGDVEAGAFQLNFGANPLGSNIFPNEDFREIYWRMYVKIPANFVDYPRKLTRARSIVSTNGADAMIAHVWGDAGNHQYLQIDPASGIVNNQLVTTKWNDQGNLTWMGSQNASRPFPKGEWVCVEAHVKLNDSGLTNGTFELYMNDQLEASRTGLDWVGTWADYGINVILFSNYWNGGATADNQMRFLDAIVVSRARIGCLGAAGVKPNPPTNLNISKLMFLE